MTEASDYSNLFENCPAGALVGETSKWYLFSRVALPQIIAINPDIKLIVLLRNPIDMASALHSHLVASETKRLPTLKMPGISSSSVVGSDSASATLCKRSVYSTGPLAPPPAASSD